MKRVLFIHSSLGGGGAERVLIDILKNIDTSTYTVDLLLIYGTGIYMKDIPNNINYLGCLYKKKRPWWKWFIARLHLGFLFERNEIRKFITSKYDTIVSFMENGAFKYHTFITDRADKNLTYVHIDLLNNHYSKYSFMGNWHERLSYQKMDTIVFVSQTAKDNFCKLFPGINTDMKVINNPIDVVSIKQKAANVNLHKNKFTICMVGRICPQKRYDRFVHAIKLLKAKGCDVDVNILGTGAQEKEMKKLVTSLNLGDVIKFLGFQNNPYPYIKQADIFCLTSDTEGYPTVICEAMVLGSAVVATDIIGSRDIVGKNEYGLLCKRTPESIATTIFHLYCHPELLSFYKQKALERSQFFGIEEAMKKIYSIL